MTQKPIRFESNRSSHWVRKNGFVHANNGPDRTTEVVRGEVDRKEICKVLEESALERTSRQYDVITVESEEQSVRSVKQERGKRKIVLFSRGKIENSRSNGLLIQL